MRRDWAQKEKYRPEKEKKKGILKNTTFFLMAALLLYGCYLFFFRQEKEARVEKQAEKKEITELQVPERRSNIYDRNLRQMAVSHVMF